MLIKSADDPSRDVADLNALLMEPNLTPIQRKRIQEELRNREKGSWGEGTAAYFLNFHFASSENHLILHDLRLVLTDGRTAQIDHLLINRFQDFYVLESKNWNQLTVDKTGACTTWAGRIIGVESPLEQCKRHANVLTVALQVAPELKKLTPRPQTIPRVLVAPGCHLKAPHHGEWYVKADAFHATRAKELEEESTLKTFMTLPRIIGKKTLMQLGETLISLHHAQSTDWRAKFALSHDQFAANNPPNKVVSSIEGLARDVPKWGNDWFVLQGKPTEQAKKAIRNAGYRAAKENGEWVWRLKA